MKIIIIIIIIIIITTTIIITIIIIIITIIIIEGRTLKVENNYQKQECLVITKEMVSKQSRKIPNWKAPGRDGVQSFWIKKLTNLHERPAFQLNKILNRNQRLPDWLTYGRTVLCQKDRTKGNAVDNFRPISCLAVMWKLLTGIISEHWFSFFRRRKDITLRTKRL